MSSPTTAFSLRAGVIVGPDQGPVSLECGCVCPGCGDALVGRQGTVRRWHFGQRNVQPGAHCNESAIDAAAKRGLLEELGLAVPEVRFDLYAGTINDQALREIYVLSPVRRIRFDGAAAEVDEGMSGLTLPLSAQASAVRGLCFRHRVD